MEGQRRRGKKGEGRKGKTWEVKKGKRNMMGKRREERERMEVDGMVERGKEGEGKE